MSHFICTNLMDSIFTIWYGEITPVLPWWEKQDGQTWDKEVKLKYTASRGCLCQRAPHWSQCPALDCKSEFQSRITVTASTIWGSPNPSYLEAIVFLVPVTFSSLRINCPTLLSCSFFPCVLDRGLMCSAGIQWINTNWGMIVQF